MSVAGVAEIAAGVGSGRVRAEEVVRGALERIAAGNAACNAMVEVFAEDALERARRIDQAVQRGERVGPLAGVPVAVKDNICLSWGKTTCASRMLEGYRSPFTATAASRLIDAGAVVVGKTNLDEFAMGSSTEHSIFGSTRNPWDVSRVPGGSSGGSAAAVAAGFVPAALGSDTGGSIRQPAGLCGVVGLKPTYGRVSRYGLVAYASSLDQIGPMTTSVRDAAVMLGVMAGHDALDATSAARPVEDFAAGVDEPVRGLRIGVPRQALSGANHPAVSAALERVLEVYRGQKAEVVEIDLPHAEHGIAAYYIVALAEASSNLARFDGVRYGRRAELGPGEGLAELYSRSRTEGFGAEVRRRIMLGTYVLSAGYYDAYYLTALKVRRLIARDFERAFAAAGTVPYAEGCDAVVMPASPTPAWGVGEKVSDPLAMYLEDVYTVGVNLAGLPAITVPAGWAEPGVGGAGVGAGVGEKRLPVGVQVIGAAWQESKLLRVARMLERACLAG